MNDIIEWLHHGKDYSQGVLLLAKYHKNKSFIRYFQRANAKRNLAKLEYELMKFVKNRPVDFHTKQQSTFPTTNLNLATQKVITTKDNAIPPLIAQAKNAVYELFTQISMAHRELFELGESNMESVIKNRKTILENRLPLIERFEKIYLLKEQYFNTGRIPTELTELLEEPNRNIEPIKIDNRQTFEKLSDIQLFKKEHAIKVAIGKYKNRLNYQSLTKGETLNPMPESPLRTKLETKIASLQAQYKIVVELIEKRK